MSYGGLWIECIAYKYVHVHVRGVFCHSVVCDFVTLLCVTLSHGCVWQFFFVSYCGYADFCGHLG